MQYAVVRFLRASFLTNFDDMSADAFFDVRVAAKQALTEDTATFELVSLDGQPLPAFTAGAHIEVALPDGLRRSYSLCNPPSERHRYQLGVLRDARSRGGSIIMHDVVQTGNTLRISSPRNQFALAALAGHSILLAGGIGITPLLSMAWQLHSDGASFELHYCTRSAGKAAFAAWLSDAPFAKQVHLHTDDGPTHQQLDLTALLTPCAAHTHVYVCGPDGFMQAVLNTARQAGWPDGQLHKELFSAEVTQEPGDVGFEVEIASTGEVIEVGADQTVVQALAAAGVDIPVSCEQGICGTCLTRVVSGTPLHRDQYLTDDEQAANDQFTPCCSRAKTARLVIDLSGL